MTGGAWVAVVRWRVDGPVRAYERRGVTTGGRSYTQRKHATAEVAHVAAARLAWAGGGRVTGYGPRASIDEPVRVDVVLVEARPLRRRRRADPDGRIPMAKGRVDVDNAAKLVLDAATKAGVWRDDTLVCALHVERWYAARDEGAATEVVVSTWRDGERAVVCLED